MKDLRGCEQFGYNNLQGPFPVGRGNRKRGRMHYRNAVFRNLEFPGREIKRGRGGDRDLERAYLTWKMLRLPGETGPSFQV